jgi:hypothetical protein
MEQLKYNQYIVIILQSGNEEQVRYKGCTRDTIIVQSNKLPYMMAINRNEIKKYYKIDRR